MFWLYFSWSPTGSSRLHAWITQKLGSETHPYSGCMPQIGSNHSIFLIFRPKTRDIPAETTEICLFYIIRVVSVWFQSSTVLEFTKTVEFVQNASFPAKWRGRVKGSDPEMSLENSVPTIGTSEQVQILVVSVWFQSTPGLFTSKSCFLSFPSLGPSAGRAPPLILL